MNKYLAALISLTVCVILLLGITQVIHSFRKDLKTEKIENEYISLQSNYESISDIFLTKEDSLIEKFDDSLAIIKADYEKALKIKQKKDSIIELNSKLKNLKLESQK